MYPDHLKCDALGSAETAAISGAAAAGGAAGRTSDAGLRCRPATQGELQPSELMPDALLDFTAKVAPADLFTLLLEEPSEAICSV